MAIKGFETSLAGGGVGFANTQGTKGVCAASNENEVELGICGASYQVIGQSTRGTGGEGITSQASTRMSRWPER